jgi:hypothetical protein
VYHWAVHRIHAHVALSVLALCTRLQGDRGEVGCFSVEPGEIGLTALEGTGDGIDQYAKNRLAQLTAGLA